MPGWICSLLRCKDPTAAVPHVERYPPSNIIHLLSASGIRTPMCGLHGTQGWARLVNVQDGDTVRIVMILPDYCGYAAKQVIVRLSGINAPKRASTDPEENRRAVAARDRLLQWATSPGVWGVQESDDYIVRKLAENLVVVYARISGADKYGRWLATLHKSDNPTASSINTILVDEGFARPYGR